MVLVVEDVEEVDQEVRVMKEEEGEKVQEDTIV